LSSKQTIGHPPVPPVDENHKKTKIDHKQGNEQNVANASKRTKSFPNRPSLVHSVENNKPDLSSLSDGEIMAKKDSSELINGVGQESAKKRKRGSSSHVIQMKTARTSKSQKITNKNKI
jgi:hypothetical protein